EPHHRHLPRRRAASRRAARRDVGGPGDRRLQLPGRDPRDGGPLLPRRRGPHRGRARPGRVHDRVPASRVLLRPAKRKAPDPACVRPRRHLPGVGGRRRHPSGDRL
ncbi:MAG: hypothetical protein AVDCRST_MAG65-108, partial [uncultured Solirubrobacteraceae bacterium]